MTAYIIVGYLIMRRLYPFIKEFLIYVNYFFIAMVMFFVVLNNFLVADYCASISIIITAIMLFEVIYSHLRDNK